MTQRAAVLAPTTQNRRQAGAYVVTTHTVRPGIYRVETTNGVGFVQDAWTRSYPSAAQAEQVAAHVVAALSRFASIAELDAYAETLRRQVRTLIDTRRPLTVNERRALAFAEQELEAVADLNELATLHALTADLAA